jgi:hypothetical protein
VNEGFIREAIIRFDAMQESLRNTLENLWESVCSPENAEL